MSASARQRVLDALLSGPKTTAELCHPQVGGERFGARILELRAAGHTIRSRRVREGSWLYEHLRLPDAHTDAEADLIAPTERPTLDGGTPPANLFESDWFCSHCRQVSQQATFPCEACGKGLLVRIEIRPPAAATLERDAA